jgi:hypothetical protein
MMAQTALKYDIEVKENGHIEFDVPFPAGAHVTVFVIESVTVSATWSPHQKAASISGTIPLMTRTGTLSQSMVVKTFGRVNAATLERVRQTLRDLTAKTP